MRLPGTDGALRALFAASAACLAVVVGLAAAQAPTAPAGGAHYVGEKACIACHGQENAHFTQTLHAKAFRLNPRNENEARVCEACHGPGSAHARNATDKRLIIGFTRGWGTPIEVQDGQCLGCHRGGNRLHWPGSIHADNRVGCADCHNPMARLSAGGLLVRQSISETCYQCHAQQRAEFRKRSHMPLPEGKMSCTDCHNPHGSPTDALIKADSVNQLCYACHAELRGPFVWEHAPVRENCLNCHLPHGSNHDKLLESPRQLQCLTCHNPVTGHPGQRAIARPCETCHTKVHGSNHPSGASLLR